MSNINYFVNMMQNLNLKLDFFIFKIFKKDSNINVFLSKYFKKIYKINKDFLILVYNF